MTRPRDEECPTDNYTEGKPSGKCWGDGHYMCKTCIHFRDDFNRLGQEYIDYIHQIQRTHINISTL